MRFFRWILSNIIMIIIVVGLIYSYVYWGNLVGSDTPAGKAVVYLSDEFVEVKEFVDGIKAKNKDKEQHEEPQKETEEVQEKPQPQQQGNQEDALVSAESEETAPVHAANTNTTTTAAENASASSITASSSANTTGEAAVAASEDDAAHNAVAETAAQSDSTVIENTEKWQPVQQPVTISYSHNKTQIQQDSSGDVHTLANNSKPAKPTAAAEIVQVETQEDGFVTPAIEKELETATADGSVAALTPDATRTVWIEARKAFYKRDFAESEKDYKRVISMTKDNYDAYGELGNVYFHQGKNSEAADAYMAASVILIRQGYTDRAKSLLGLMRYLDKDKALLLQKRLEDKK